ncbi:inositol-3-phosphate synthase [Thermoplasmatales archaeon SW_10_69_26]|nr:MAG: inositol-3-phosphate synthase [Thermoplasmatales archaeon SW_10_69_26]
MAEIRLAVAGVGNCASSLLQGIEYYRRRPDADPIGLMHREIGNYDVSDVEVVTAFDVDERKVGKDVADAIEASPNCTQTILDDGLGTTGATVHRGPLLDGVPDHMTDYDEAHRFAVGDDEPVDVVEELQRSGADVLINYVPVGAEEAARHYAEAALEAGVAYVNCMPCFIASDDEWARRFTKARVPIVGDDVKSQVGATIVHRTLTRLFEDRGVHLDNTYQLNFGGNTDFLNMLDTSRLSTKKTSKTESVRSQMDDPLDDGDIHIGPSDYVAWQDDNKVAFIRLEGRGWADVPLDVELRLSVEDSPNSAGVAIDAIRCAKLALDRGIGGPLEEISAYTMKHPPVQYEDNLARDLVERFIQGMPAYHARRKMRAWFRERAPEPLKETKLLKR